jgi:5'-deoxynucleotidase YfbR-like HD superfamily hydrolase
LTSIFTTFSVLFFVADEIKELWEEYENNSSIEANLVKDFDKVSVPFIF